ncbi:hypothetical protein [Rhizobium rhizogenes]|uniref:hypothetical protein n=1 Tax=Rhizobium rhizogenes TaxID=359 RepID=UPI0022C22C03|nr:hypothetical protein [Rhizobium rhizogenes]MCZ7466423.1 hypothetical protein [Rhizobium rhizogenes]
MFGKIPVNPGKLPNADALRQLVREGNGRTQIAARYGVTQDRVRARLKELGMKAPLYRVARPAEKLPTMTLRTDSGPISLPRISIIQDMEKYACL